MGKGQPGKQASVINIKEIPKTTQNRKEKKNMKKSKINLVMGCRIRKHLNRESQTTSHATETFNLLIER